MKHSPGPWIARNRSDGSTIIRYAQGDAPVALVYHPLNVPVIAASPLLLEACRLHIKASQTWDRMDEEIALKAARDAIALAEPSTDEVVLANAVKAAPDLLEAAKAAIDEIENDDPSGALAILRTVVALAEPSTDEAG